MDACRASGQVTLTVSGAYAGKPFGPFSFTTRLDAAGLASTIATKVVTYVLGV
jgi:hypothetical protein